MTRNMTQMSELLSRSRGFRLAAFAGMGLLLLATSPEPIPGIVYAAKVEVPDTVLDNGAPTQRVTFMLRHRDGGDPAEPTRATVRVAFEATHSDPSPQTQADNTPWVSARPVSPGLPDTDGGLPGAEATSAGPFLHRDTLLMEQSAWLDSNGRGELTIEVTRADTATDITTRVHWQVEFEAWVPADRDAQAELPWDITVDVEGGRP